MSDRENLNEKLFSEIHVFHSKPRGVTKSPARAPAHETKRDDETSLDLSHWCMMSITDPPGTRRAVETLIP